MARPSRVVARWQFEARQLSASAATGRLNQIRVEWPRPTPALSLVGFRSGSAFPSPNLAVGLKPIQERLDDDETLDLAVFGHSDANGSPADNKALAERRVAAVLALARADADALFELAEREGWALDCYQSMLRGLGFVPGAIDGRAGPMTDAAIEAFVDARAQDWLDRDGPRPSPGPSLDAPTRRAIVGAYVEEFGLAIDASRLLNGPASGCGELNLLGLAPARERRVTLAVLERGPTRPRPADFPCVEGELGACALDREAAPRCKFFRIVAAPQTTADPVEFFDFAWLRTPSGKIHLSALTTAAETDALAVEIGIAEGGLSQPPPCSSAGRSPPRLRRLARVTGLVRHGVCYALWDPGDFDPFDPRQWFTNDPSAPEIEGLPVPTFELRIGDDWAWATPPGRRLDRIVLRGEAEREVLALLADGSYLRFDGREGLQDVDEALRTAHVLAIFPRDGVVEDGRGPS